MRSGELYLVERATKNDTKKQRVYVVVSRQCDGRPRDAGGFLFACYLAITPSLHCTVTSGLEPLIAFHCAFVPSYWTVKLRQL